MTNPRKNLDPMHIVSIAHAQITFALKPSSPIQKKGPGDGDPTLTTACLPALGRSI